MSLLTGCEVKKLAVEPFGEILQKRGRGAKRHAMPPLVDLPGTHSPEQRHPVGNVVASLNGTLMTQRGAFERVDG